MKKILFSLAVAAGMMTFASCGNKTSMGDQLDTLSYEFGVVTSPGENIGMMLAQQGSDSNYVAQYIDGYKEGLKLAADTVALRKEMARYAGIMAALQLKQGISYAEMQVFQGDSTKHFNQRLVVAGHLDAVKKEVVLKNANGEAKNQQDCNSDLMEYMFSAQKKENAEWLAKKAKEEGVQAGPNGIYYKVLSEGNGTKPTLASTIEVVYEGSLIDGTVFDATKNHGKDTDKMPLGNMIEGWKAILPLMGEGAEWELYIPYEQGYGDRGSQMIKPFSTLIFKVKLVKANAAPEKPEQPQTINL